MKPDDGNGPRVGIIAPVSDDAIAVAALAVGARAATRGTGFLLWWIVLGLIALSCAGVMRARSKTASVQDKTGDVGRP